MLAGTRSFYASAHVGRLISRLCASACVCMRMLASVCVCLTSVVLSRVCVRLLVNARVCLHQRFRMLASVVLSRVGRLVSRRSSCLASVCVCLRELAQFMRLLTSVVLSRVCVHLLASVCECSRLCASVSRRSSCLASVVLSRVCVRLLAGTGSVHASACVGCHSKSSKVGGTGSGFCYLSRVILSPCCTYRLCRLYEQTFNILI